MGGRKTSMAVALMAVAVVQWVAQAAVHKVGESAGWTTMGNVDYKLWAATKTFDLGDVIKFEYYSQFHNVMRVTHSMYKSCNGSKPMETYTTGNDSITITTRGHHYFMCGVPGHCQAGQKVDINVPHLPSPATTPPVLSSPSVPVLNTPKTYPTSNAASYNHFNAHFGFQVIVIFINFASVLTGF